MRLSIRALNGLGLSAYAENHRISGGNFLCCYAPEGVLSEEVISKLKKHGFVTSDGSGHFLRIPEDYWGLDHSELYRPVHEVIRDRDAYERWLSRSGPYDERGGRAWRTLSKSVY